MVRRREPASALSGPETHAVQRLLHLEPPGIPLFYRPKGDGKRRTNRHSIPCVHVAGRSAVRCERAGGGLSLRRSRGPAPRSLSGLHRVFFSSNMLLHRLSAKRLLP